MKKISITDTLSGTKKNINEDNHKTLKIYICGITPYDDPHIGHARCYVVYDVLFRALKWFSTPYIYCRNVTDIDDKLISKAINLYGNGSRFVEIVNKYHKIFLNNLDMLGCLRPCMEPKVTENIDEIIDFINNNMDNLVISIDGRPDVHDAMRYYNLHKGSYDTTLKNAKSILAARDEDKSHYIRGTYTKKNLDFSKDVEHLIKEGFKEISIEPVVGSGEDFHLKDDDIENIKLEYEKLTMMILKKREIN